ncbi:hypothetical protein H5202_22300 [Shewanella sp. SG41-4]|nr:hypothetical protein [Shewanella sp. SG41-4]MBB1441304.1 hypothetical protein [Shewanella sp. SG41-4]
MNKQGMQQNLMINIVHITKRTNDNSEKAKQCYFYNSTSRIELSAIKVGS